MKLCKKDLSFNLFYINFFWDHPSSLIFFQISHSPVKVFPTVGRRKSPPTGQIFAHPPPPVDSHNKLLFPPPLLPQLSNFSNFLPRQIKCQVNYIKIHFASEFPWQCFCRGWQDLILRASVYTLAALPKSKWEVNL